MPSLEIKRCGNFNLCFGNVFENGHTGWKACRSYSVSQLIERNLQYSVIVQFGRQPVGRTGEGMVNRKAYAARENQWDVTKNKRSRRAETASAIGRDYCRRHIDIARALPSGICRSASTMGNHVAAVQPSSTKRCSARGMAHLWLTWVCGRNGLERGVPKQGYCLAWRHNRLHYATGTILCEGGAGGMERFASCERSDTLRGLWYPILAY